MASDDVEVDGFDFENRNPDSMVGIVVDGIIGAVGGATGTAAMTVVLLVASTLGGFQLESFGVLAEMTGLAVLAPGNETAVGYIIFLLGGMITWPLLFASIGRYLPGKNYATAGAVFGAILWTGFVLAFYVDYTGAALVIYVVSTFLAHVVYGFGLGSVLDYLGGREAPIV